jgi:uncharacterized protein (DUF2236 family)
METASDQGLFDPESVICRVSRELLLLLGGGRALLMQVAHPLVAAGVVEHSDYRENPWVRLERTMAAVWAIVFGTRAEAERVGARVRSLHARVHGRLAERAGPFAAGTEYSASDPKLLMWVHATLVDTALLVHGRWVGRLEPAEAEDYYEQMKTLARVFGTPDSVIPPTLADFRLYMSERLASPEITVTPAARDVLASVVDPPLPLPLRLPWQALNAVTASLLPARLREEYGVGFGRLRASAVGASSEVVRRALPLVPAFVRTVPPARRRDNSLASLA